MNSRLSFAQIQGTSIVFDSMPQAKAKPSEIASEAKKTYTPHIQAQYPQFPPTSISYPDSSKLRLTSPAGSANKLRVAVIEGDPVDVALGWHDSNMEENGATRDIRKQAAAIPVVNMANEKRAGGDWESGLIAPEECLCRRSNLAKVLTTPTNLSGQVPHYPIRTTGGIYSPHVGALPLTEISEECFRLRNQCSGISRWARQRLRCLENLEGFASHLSCTNTTSQTRRVWNRLLIQPRTRTYERKDANCTKNQRRAAAF